MVSIVSLPESRTNVNFHKLVWLTPRLLHVPFPILRVRCPMMPSPKSGCPTFAMPCHADCPKHPPSLILKIAPLSARKMQLAKTLFLLSLFLPLHTLPMIARTDIPKIPQMRGDIEVEDIDGIIIALVASTRVSISINIRISRHDVRGRVDPELRLHVLKTQDRWRDAGDRVVGVGDAEVLTLARRFDVGGQGVVAGPGRAVRV